MCQNPLDGTVPFSIIPEGGSFTSTHDSGERKGTWYIKGHPPYYERKGSEIPPNAWTVSGQDRYVRFGPAAPVRPTPIPN